MKDKVLEVLARLLVVLLCVFGASSLEGCVGTVRNDNPYKEDIKMMELAKANNVNFSEYSHSPTGALAADNAIPTMEMVRAVRLAADGKVLVVGMKEKYKDAEVIVWAKNRKGEHLSYLNRLGGNAFDLTSSRFSGEPVMFNIICELPNSGDRLKAYQSGRVSRENAWITNRGGRRQVVLESNLRSCTDPEAYCDLLPRKDLRYPPEVISKPSS